MPVRPSYNSGFPILGTGHASRNPWRELVGRLFLRRPKPLTASDIGKMGRAAQLRTFQARMDAKHEQLRTELGR